MKTRLLILLLPLLFLASDTKAATTNSPVLSPEYKKVLLVIYNPTLKDGKKEVESQQYNDPISLTNQYISDIQDFTDGLVSYQIAEVKELDAFPKKKDGFVYTKESYAKCLENKKLCHADENGNRAVSYQDIMRSINACKKKNAGEIDEIWLWGGSETGFSESNLVGPEDKAFFLNSSPTIDNSCKSVIPVMGFNFERGEAEMMEDLGHRVEFTLSKIFGSWKQVPTHPWNKFSLLDVANPGQGGCGTAHLAVNSGTDDLRNYDRTSKRSVLSACDDFYNYPNLTGKTTQISCEVWGCDTLSYFKWWLKHLPKKPGTYDGTLNNWWVYVTTEDISRYTYQNPSCSNFDNNQDGCDNNGGCSYFLCSNKCFPYGTSLNTGCSIKNQITSAIKSLLPSTQKSSLSSPIPKKVTTSTITIEDPLKEKNRICNGTTDLSVYRFYTPQDINNCMNRIDYECLSPSAGNDITGCMLSVKESILKEVEKRAPGLRSVIEDSDPKGYTSTRDSLCGRWGQECINYSDTVCATKPTPEHLSGYNANSELVICINNYLVKASSAKNAPAGSAQTSTAIPANNVLTVSTKALAQVNGISSGQQITDIGSLTIAGLVYTDESNIFQSCIQKPISLKLTKEQSNFQSTKNDVVEYKAATNCQNITIPAGTLTEGGTYTLNVSFDGTNTGYGSASATAIFTYQKTTKTQTNTNLGILSLSKQDSGFYGLSSDQFAQDGITLKGCTNPGSDSIVALSLSYTLRDFNGKFIESRIKTVPNCQDALLGLTDVSDISNLGYIDLAANFIADSNSSYYNSQSKSIGIIINHPDQQPKAEEVVVPSANSTKPNISIGLFPTQPANELVKITAISHTIINNPKFEVVSERQSTIFTKIEKIEDCQNNQGDCVYQVQPWVGSIKEVNFFDGDTKLQTFQINKIDATNETTVKPKTVQAVYLQIPSGEAELPLGGSSVDFPINDGRTDIRIHVVYSDGTDVYRYFAIVYQPDQAKICNPGEYLRACLDAASCTYSFKQCNTSGTEYGDDNTESNCQIADNVPGPFNGTCHQPPSEHYEICQYQEAAQNCPNGGTRTCNGVKLAGEVCHYDSTKQIVTDSNCQEECNFQSCQWNFLRNECTSCGRSRSVEQDCHGNTRISAEGVADPACIDGCSNSGRELSCDDLYFPDSNQTTGCTWKHPGPNIIPDVSCDYQFEPSNSANCGL